MDPETRSLTEIASDLTADTARLAGALHLAGADAEPLTDLMGRVHDTAEIIAASGIGRAQGIGAARQEPHSVADLASVMAADVAKLAAGLADAGADRASVMRLQSDTAALHKLALKMVAEHPALARQAPPRITTATPLTKPLAGVRPGERPTSLDYAGHRLEAALRAARLNREALG
jgi:hypothetical protein